MKITNVIIASATCLFSPLLIADCRVSSPAWTQQFNQVYQADEFYIYYTNRTNSKDRVPQQDINKNNIPDYVEDVARQAQASRDMFEVAKLQHPLHSPRYKNKAQAIAVFIKDMKGNGVAYEVVSRHPSVSTQTPMPCSLVINISNRLTDFPGNYWTTVTHELFHLYQYGYSQFKNSWYLESLANWSERALRIDINQQTKNLKALPQNVKALEQEIFKASYNPLWRRYFYIQPNDVLNVPKQLQLKTYIDGSPIFKDHVWYGTRFVKNFLVDLSAASYQISEQYQWPKYNWKEADQRRTEFNCTIFTVYQKQLKKQKKLTKEAQFLASFPLSSNSPQCK